MRTIELNYKKTPHFNEIYELFKESFEKDFKYLYLLNQDLIIKVCQKLKFNLMFLESDKLIHEYNPNLKGNDLVLEITKKSKCSSYLSGKGCQEFIKPETFLSAGIKFLYHEYIPTKYRQNSQGIFLENLSIIDALFNLGCAGTRKLIL